MKNTKMTAVICAWRNPEPDLSATLESAKASLGRGAKIYAVEDKTADGPGRTRHRAIEAAGDADVCIIIDAHMKFDGATLATLAAYVRKHGGLACPLVHHNPLCAFGGWYDDTGTAQQWFGCDPDGTPCSSTTVPGWQWPKNWNNAATYYAGARIVYRAKNGNEKHALCAKWSKDQRPGQRAAVMGACYAFRRDWYYQVGQPLAALPGWGCDEEALSIASWLSGHMPVVLDGRVAHLYRARPPWNVMHEDYVRIWKSRMALIHAVVSEAGARRELEAWQRSWVPANMLPFCNSNEAERFRLALLKLPRKWAEWRREVCEPDEIDGVHIPPVQIGPDSVDRRQATGYNATKEQKKLDKRVQNPVVPMHGVDCPHCGKVHDPKALHVENTFPNGNRRHICPNCGNPFISKFTA